MGNTVPPRLEPSAPTADTFAGTGAEVLVECLIRVGIDTIFGVPGDTGVAFYDALYHRTDRIRHVLARDERHAAAMADAYARASNTVGAVEVSSGGGVSYVIGGLAEAFAASVPILVISSDIFTGSRNTGALTELDQEQLFTAVTKWRAVVEHPDDLPRLLAEALTQATTGRPAPVALILPENVLDEPAQLRLPVSDPTATHLPRQRTAADAETIDAAAALLRDAARPAILAGSGVHLSGAHHAIADLATHAAIPVATSIHGKGALPDDHPYSLGVVGANGAREYANAYLRQADAVLLVGTRANATDTNSWTGPPREGVAVVAIDICAERAGRNFPGSLRLVADARTALTQLRAALPAAAEPTRAAVAARIARSRESWRPAPPTTADRAAKPDRIDPRQIVQVACEVLSERCTVLADPGTPTPNAAAYWDLTSAGRNVIIPRGHGPMGYAIPAAIGAALARPDDVILSITADGSFAMACGELETVCRLELPIAYVQLTNHSLGWIKMLQELYFERRYFGVDPGPFDAVAVAAAAGLRAVRVTSLHQLADELTRVAADRCPVYLDVQVPNLMQQTPPVAPWQQALAGDPQRPVY